MSHPLEATWNEIGLTVWASGNEDTQIISNEELVCFRDIDPAAPHHYLVIPRLHIMSCFSLFKEHVSLVERMADMGEAVLQAHGVIDMNDTRFGFHRPPFTSVDHLHLHVLAPASQITDHMKYKFLPGTLRFVTDYHLCKKLCDSPMSSHIFHQEKHSQM